MPTDGSSRRIRAAGRGAAEFSEWDRHYAALVKFVEREGHANVPTKHVEGDVMLGRWVSSQHQRYRWLHAHHPSRIARLAALRGWFWRRS